MRNLKLENQFWNYYRNTNRNRFQNRNWNLQFFFTSKTKLIRSVLLNGSKLETSKFQIEFNLFTSLHLEANGSLAILLKAKKIHRQDCVNCTSRAGGGAYFPLTQAIAPLMGELLDCHPVTHPCGAYILKGSNTCTSTGAIQGPECTLLGVT